MLHLTQVKSENHASMCILSLNLLFFWKMPGCVILVNVDFGESSTITELFSTKCFRSKEDNKYPQQRTLFFWHVYQHTHIIRELK